MAAKWRSKMAVQMSAMSTQLLLTSYEWCLPQDPTREKQRNKKSKVHLPESNPVYKNTIHTPPRLEGRLIYGEYRDLD
ncbi:jg17619 [Pararge aegeria aegeria]|uniref:Jg17619 protein n=1 Tax=Pararge aegeria aegeria TaxID=348720 RepID=A0A8S4R1D2_9NEOP|nr:jg17619 [Pararge aegeria aegeria]